MKIQGYGWIRDLPDQRDLKYAPPPQLAEALPPMVDLRDGFPACYDQSALGSCTANAIAGALQYLERKEGDTTPTMPSRLFIYYNERVIEGSVDSDSGAQLRDGIKVVHKEGFCPEAEWPYDIARFADPPPRQCYQDALRECVSQYLRLDRGMPLLTCLASGYPFVFGFSVYESFESERVRRSGIAPLPEPGEQLLGGHAVCAVGYDLNKRTYLVRNSWGTDWGLEGYFTMPFDYLATPRLSADFWTLRQVPIDAAMAA